MRQAEKTLAELAAVVNAILRGDQNCVITSIGPLQSAKAGQITFLDNPKYRQYLSNTQASAVILSEMNADFCSVNALIVKNPYLAYAKIAAIFAEYPKPIISGTHQTAIIGQDCQIDPTVNIGAHVVIGNHVIIGRNTQIDSGCVIGDDCQIGSDCHLWANVTLYYRAKLGNRVVVHSGTVIGSDGFGFAHHQGGWYKVPQLGSVVICDDVDIGANTVIDRGALEDTLIEKGVILDNLIQIAHNVHIGEYTAVAGCTGIAGSAEIGKHCMIGGGSSINGHIKITDDVMLTGTTTVNNSIKEPGIYSSGIPAMKNEQWRKNAIRFRQLDQMAKKLNSLEKMTANQLKKE
jgi:UDP-3-O-[3-hydroxymyristoyl] glucosamine N-acyltransferase